MKKGREERKQNNKGFSLVELIIVIAIMAILVGIVGSQVVPYMEKARESRDLAALDSAYTAVLAYYAESESTANVSGQTVRDYLGTSANLVDIAYKFSSKKAKKADKVDTLGDATVTITGGAVTISAGDLSVSKDGAKGNK